MTRATLHNASIHLTARIDAGLLARFRRAQERARRLGERSSIADIMRDSILAFVLHHEGRAPIRDPRQLSLIDEGDQP